MVKRDIVVFGGSAGGIRATRDMLGELPEKVPAAIFLVRYTSVHSPGLLPDAPATPGSPCVRYGKNGEAFERSVVYVTPPDLHMLLEAQGCIRLAFGPKEHRFRPAVDPLFRSAALAFGSRVMGVVKAAGGLTVVQHPQEAEESSMPQSALDHVAVDHCLPVRDIAGLLIRLSSGEGSLAEHAVRRQSSDHQEEPGPPGEHEEVS